MAFKHPLEVWGWEGGKLPPLGKPLSPPPPLRTLVSFLSRTPTKLFILTWMKRNITILIEEVLKFIIV